MIQDEKNVFSDDGEYSVFFDDDGDGELYNTYDEFDRDNLEEFKNYILDNFDLDTDDIEALKEVDDNDILESFISMYDVDVNHRSFTREHFISDITEPFLTKESCKEHLKSYCYNWAINFGLFYIGYSKHIIHKGFNLDFNSNLGLLRFIKKG